MKHILFIFFILPYSCFCQTDLSLFTVDTSRHIVADANVIYVQNNDFKKVCNAVLDAGFTIDKKDIDLQTVETKEFKEDVWIPLLSIRIKDSVTVIRSKSYISGMWIDGLYKENKNGKPKHNAFIHSFLQAYKVARLIGGKIECKKE